MKVTAFIRKTASKNNVTDLARVYFRLRDKGGVDIKAASELSISPNHWSAEKQGYKSRIALVSDEKRMTRRYRTSHVSFPGNITEEWTASGYSH